MRSTAEWLVALLTAVGFAVVVTCVTLAGLLLMDRIEKWARR